MILTLADKARGRLLSFNSFIEITVSKKIFMFKEKVLVTGGAGFIGSHLVRALLDDNYQVRVLDNFSTGHKKNLLEVLDKIEFIEGDISNQQSVINAVSEVDYILHEAAMPSVPRSIQYPATTTHVNTVGLINILQAAKNCGVKRIVIASSSSVYGDTPILPKQEDQIPNPISPYAVNKYAGELFCKTFYHLHGLSFVALRYFNVFGPRQDPLSPYSAVIPLFIKAFKNNEPLVIYGDGKQSRDFSYVDNVVQANLLALKSTKAGGQVINIACQQAISLNDIVKELNIIFNKNLIPQYLPSRPGDIRDSLADISRAKNLLGYQPNVFVKEGLAKTVKWYLKN